MKRLSGGSYIRKTIRKLLRKNPPRADDERDSRDDQNIDASGESIIQHIPVIERTTIQNVDTILAEIESFQNQIGQIFSSNDSVKESIATIHSHNLTKITESIEADSEDEPKKVVTNAKHKTPTTIIRTCSDHPLDEYILVSQSLSEQPNCCTKPSVYSSIVPKCCRISSNPTPHSCSSGVSPEMCPGKPLDMIDCPICGAKNAMYDGEERCPECTHYDTVKVEYYD